MSLAENELEVNVRAINALEYGTEKNAVEIFGKIKGIFK